MKRFCVNDANAVTEIASILNDGGVAAVPTETVYGLIALWDNTAARERIYELKARPTEKRLQMLAGSVDMAIKAGLLPDARLYAIEKNFWPGPLTVVAASRDNDTIGLRIPAHTFMLKLLKLLDRPLAATSANLSGMPPGLDAGSAISNLTGQPEALVDGGSVELTGGHASTVVSLVGKQPTILRQGPIELDTILSVFKQ